VDFVPSLIRPRPDQGHSRTLAQVTVLAPEGRHRWETSGDEERAELERRNAEIERLAAQLERDRADRELRRTAETV
jgi:hypothetical protein